MLELYRKRYSGDDDDKEVCAARALVNACTFFGPNRYVQLVTFGQSTCPAATKSLDNNPVE